MSNKKEMIHGWWSDSQAKIGGYNVYTTPSGKTVKCSMVSPSDKHNTYWKDMVYLGVVCDYLEHYDANGQMTSQSPLGRDMADERMPSTTNEVIEFMAYKGLTTFNAGKC
jgi:hypothetical protein